MKKKFRLPRRLKKKFKKERVSHNWHLPFDLDKFRRSFDAKEYKLNVLNMPDVMPKPQKEKIEIIHIEPPKMYQMPRHGIGDYFFP